MAFPVGAQVQGLQKRQFNQVMHDERCRPELEKFLKHLAKYHQKPSLTKAADWMRKSGIPAPRGGDWSTSAVFRISKRLGLVITCGRAFGEFKICKRCGRQLGRWFSEDYCDTCEERKHRIRIHRGVRAADLVDAREKLEYYRAKVEALEAGRRFYSRQHPEPTHRFGRPIRKARGKNEMQRG